jgi:hypothetical protein
MSTPTPSTGKKVGAGQGKMPEKSLVPVYIRNAVIASVCSENVYDTQPRMILSTSRGGYLPQARGMVVFLLRAVWGDSGWSNAMPRAWATWHQIALVVRREHATASYAYDQVTERLLPDEPYYRERLDCALDELAGRLGPREKARIATVKARLGAL